MESHAPNKLAQAKVTDLKLLNNIFEQYFDNPPRMIAPEPPRPVGNVPRNNAGQRIDPRIESSQLDRKTLQDKKRERLCNEYHLRGPEHCIYSGGCRYVHGSINEQVRRVLQDLARYTHCKYGTGCSYLDCYAGHRCPYGLCQGTCQFPKEMHFADRIVVNGEQRSGITHAMTIETAGRTREQNAGGIWRSPSESIAHNLFEASTTTTGMTTIGPTTPSTSISSTDWRQRSGGRLEA